MTKDLDLSTSQRAGIDSVMKHTDSSLRAIPTEMQPRLQQVFLSSRAEIESRLDSAQRVEIRQVAARRERGTTPVGTRYVRSDDREDSERRAPQGECQCPPNPIRPTILRPVMRALESSPALSPVF